MRKLVKVSPWLGLGLFATAIVCITAFNMIGQEVDAQGILHEPFFLIPLTWLFLFISLIAGGVNVVARVIQSRSKGKENR